MLAKVKTPVGQNLALILTTKHSKARYTLGAVSPLVSSLTTGSSVAMALPPILELARKV